MRLYSKTETDSQIERKTSGYQKGEGMGEGWDKGMGSRDTNYYL